MAISGVDIVEQLRGRMKFYHVGDPVRKDMGAACEEISELRVQGMLMQALIDEAEKRLDSVDSVTGDGLSRVPSVSVLDAASVRRWLLERTDPELKREIGVKLTPSQRTTFEELETLVSME